MLERAPAYFEKGGRHFLCASAPQSIRSPRTLHPSSRHHDSHSQPLAHLQNAPEKLSPQKDASDLGEHSTAAEAHQADGNVSFLYFLYPNRTLALMRRYDSPPRSLGMPNLGRRYFSSSREGPKDTSSQGKRPREDDSDKGQAERNAEGIELDENYVFEQKDDEFGSDVDAFPPDSSDAQHRSSPKAQTAVGAVGGGEQGKRPKISELIKRIEQSDNKTEAISKLIDLYSDSSIDKESRDVLPQAIWRLWNALTAGQRTPRLATAILQHFGSIRPFLRTYAERIIQVFESLPQDCRVGQSYNSAILAYLTIQGPGKAALVYLEGVSRALSGDIHRDFLEHDSLWKSGRAEFDWLRPTPELLISRAIADFEWQLAIDLIATAQKIGTIDWAIIGNGLDLGHHLSMLLLRLRELQRLGAEPTESELELRELTEQLSRQAIAQMAASWSPESSQAQIWRLLLRLKRSGYVSADVQAELHARALEGILHAKEITKHFHLPPLVFRLYDTYVTALLEDRERPSVVPIRIRPSTFVCMLHGFIRHPKLPEKETVNTGVVYYHYKLFEGRPSVTVLSLLMHYHASQGNDRRVNAYFKELLTYQKRSIRENPKIFRSVFYVLSRKGDVAGTENLIKYMKEEFGLTPDSEMWNSVLKAHVRKDDFLGAWNRLRQMTKVTKLNDNSFRIILEPLAERGDVEAVKEIFDMISELDSTILRDSRTVLFLVLAYVKSDDLHSAERFAMQLQELKADGQLEGDTTSLWNIIASEYARQRDAQAVQRILAFMTQHGIPYDAHTYSALLLALANIHQTDVAYKILRTVITKEPVESLALHYAIVMSGYISQRRYWKVWYVDRFRQHRRVPSSFSTRSALIQAVLLNEIQMNRETGSDKLEKTERMALGQMKLVEPWDISREIQLGTKFTPANQLRDSWLDTLIHTFGSKKMFDMAQKMFDVYAKRNDIEFSDPERTPPIRMLVALMNNFLHAEQHEEVEQCWHLAKQQADKLSQLRPASIAREFASQEDESLRKAVPRKKMLTSALAVYMMSLKNQERVEDIQRVVQSLLGEGYLLSNSLWNNYIQLLARSGRIVQAFSLTETELMTRWPGWRKPQYAKIKRYNRGWHYLYVSALREPPGTKLPTYKTMVFLAAALKYVRRAEAVGTGGEGITVTEAFLEKRAPTTVKAVMKMPRVDDPLQTRFLGDNL
ncbi:hypothetical protein IWX47DRAFT_861144 [Phyllosticta citricarpa]